MTRLEKLNSLKRHYSDVDNVEPYERNLFDFSHENIDIREGEVSLYFRNIENAIVRKINQADVVVGCVAWMTSRPIINALSKKYGAS